MTQGSSGFNEGKTNSSDHSSMKRRSLSAPNTPTGRNRVRKRNRNQNSRRSSSSNGVAAPNLVWMSQKRKSSGGIKRQRPAKRKQKRNSIIVIDSDESESEISVVEIIDASNSIIELSDDETGVCSGLLSSSRQEGRKPLKPSNWNEKDNVAQNAKITTDQSETDLPKSSEDNTVIIEDLTGRYIKEKEPPESSSSIQAPGTSTVVTKNVEIYQPLADKNDKTGLRPIVIDGCNVAFGHGRDRFSSLGLKICIDYFKKLGHEVRAFVPQFRRHHSATMNPELLDLMEKAGTLSFTPSRRQIDGKMIVSYDDRFVVQYADAVGGIIVSRDNYRDLVQENPEWKETINRRLLMFTWVGDTIMFPKDPLGRGGPNLQDFLKFNP